MLLAWWFLALLIAGACVVPAGWVALAIRRRRRRRAGRPVISGWRLTARRAALSVATVTFTLAAVAAALNDHFSYIPSFHALFGDVSPDLVSHPVAAESARRGAAGAQRGPEPGAAEAVSVATKKTDHGTVEKVEVDGPASAIGPRDTYVYLPPQYFDPARPGGRFPVLYLLHGSPGISVDWIRGGWVDRAMDDLLGKGEIAPFIVVMPDVNGGYKRDTECEDIPNGPQVQTYLTRDVVAYIDANYRTIADRSGRAIGGLSTGGYCAVNLVLRHQDVFSGMVSHSGYDRPDRNLYTGDLFGGDRNALRDNTPGLYLPTIPLTRPLGVYLDVGASDAGSRAESIAMARVFEQRQIPVAFHDFAEEAHNWASWRRNLFSSLPWVSSWFVSTGAATAPGSGPGTPAVLAAPAPPATTGGGHAPEPPPAASDLAAPPDANHAPTPMPAVAAGQHGGPAMAHRGATAAGGRTGTAAGQGVRRRPLPAAGRRATP
jgi:enterochelin esterase-like enzyme